MAEVVKTKLTREFYNSEMERLKFLKSTKRNEIIERIEIARGHGDLSENSEYDEAKNAQAENELEIANLEETLKNVEIIDDVNQDTSEVKMGLVVTLHNSKKNTEDDYFIVGSAQADPFKKFISNVSPLGREVLGKKVGDKFKVTAPSGAIEYTVIAIKTRD